MGTNLGADFIFELSSFAGGFFPTVSNTADRTSHWRVAERTSYNPGDQCFRGHYVVESNEVPFGNSDFGFIWRYSSEVGNDEWVFMSGSDWKWPNESG